MIIRLTKANFSSNNIGQYTTEPGTLTFNVSPSNASWTLTCAAMSPSTKTGTGNTTWANIPAGSTVSYEVSLSGYNTQKGSISIYGNTSKTITLSEVGSVTPPVTPPVEPETPPVEPETPETGNTLTFVNGDAVVVDSVADMQFTIGKSFGGGTPYNTMDTVGRAASYKYVLKVNGGETITLNQPFEGKTIYYSTLAFSNNTDTKAHSTDRMFTMQEWVTASKVIPSEIKYLFIAFKNDGGTVDFTTDEIATIKNNFIIS